MSLRDFWDHHVRRICCATPTKGGYSFWRCGKPRGHSGSHRFRNYTFNEQGTFFRPIPHDIRARRLRDVIR